ncbi:hypothetical protein [Luteibacter rhizovicinus]|nr:hypothetical protein [Luteibacter rhizovicinus]
MSNTDHPHEAGSFRKNSFPLKFTDHNFSAYCFSTIGCKVFYHGRYDVEDRDDEVSSPLMGPDHLQHLDAVRVGIQNFPPPAIVSWRSKDGAYHEAKIDLDEIFKDRRIVHNVDERDIPDNASVADPDILLVVNDRTISVYMKAFIPLKHQRDPGNKYSALSHDAILVYAKTY